MEQRRQNQAERDKRAQEAFKAVMEEQRRWYAAEEARRMRQAEDERKAREAAEEREQQHRRQAQAQADEEARNRQAAQQSEHEQQKRLYASWRAQCVKDFAKVGKLTTFPHLPAAICTCKEVLCQSSKAKEPLRACRHDLEKLLRLSGQYSREWLKAERKEWHPDKFSRRCDPDFRKEVQAKATMLFTTFGQLIDAAGA